jgi:hypothetical protein
MIGQAEIESPVWIKKSVILLSHFDYFDKKENQRSSQPAQ